MKRSWLRFPIPRHPRLFAAFKGPRWSTKRGGIDLISKGRRICAPPKSRVAEETHSVTSRHVLYGEPPTPECFWMSGSCDGVPHPANDRAKTANSKARKRRIFTSQIVIANEPIMVRSILMSIQVGGKTRRFSKVWDHPANKRKALFLSSWNCSIARVGEGETDFKILSAKPIREKMFRGASSLRFV